MKTGTAKFNKLPAMLLNFEARSVTKKFADITDKGNIFFSILNIITIH